MKLSQAQNLAERIIETMQPFCQRVAIGGSIRREKPEVKDIEIVAIPKFGDPVDLFFEPSSSPGFSPRTE